MTAAPPRARRPFGVTLLVILIVLSGLGSLVGGIVLTAVHNNRDVVQSADTSSGTLLGLGIAAILTGLIYLMIARGLARGNGFARFLVGLVTLLNLIGGVWVAVTASGNLRTQGVVSAVVALIVLLILYSSRANRFFREN